ncbi:DoxX family protein [Pandoraea cepalis]|uniref:DoxX family protein n=1 Tax=Pandoraea cepalis TaxID=2508294 RepID=A0A5E4VMA4_9BURK|nr:DoxX family protein [Pandoraea cepalis]VVE12160.1 DoxX family protein [Pandoraea cepalis]
MTPLPSSPDVSSAVARKTRSLPGWIYWLALLLLCSAYLQGGIDKAMDFPGAIAEMRHFGLSPAAPMALAVIVLEIGASLLILTGRWRWLGALALAGFTLAASCLANRFWAAPPEARLMLANGFFEHLGLVGGFVAVAWYDLSANVCRSA